jgi:hypothetical protein
MLTVAFDTGALDNGETMGVEDAPGHVTYVVMACFVIVVTMVLPLDTN